MRERNNLTGKGYIKGRLHQRIPVKLFFIDPSILMKRLIEISKNSNSDTGSFLIKLKGVNKDFPVLMATLEYKGIFNNSINGYYTACNIMRECINSPLNQ